MGFAETGAPTGTGLIKNARGEFRVGNFDRALSLLDQAGKSSAADADALDLRGSILLEQGRFEEAKKAFTAASEANRNRFLPKLHFGDVLLREKKYAEARDIYNGLLRGETNIQVANEKLRYAVLLTYLFAQDEARAQIALDRIGFPTESPAYYYAQAAWEFGHGRPGEAKQWIKAAAKMFKEDSIAWFARPFYSFGWLQGKPSLPAS
jgi:tetratricopeptide (TPR) repeat protein